MAKSSTVRHPKSANVGLKLVMRDDYHGRYSRNLPNRGLPRRVSIHTLQSAICG